MKKYSVLLAVIALALSSLACKTVMGGGDTGFQSPTDSTGVATAPPVTTDGGNVTVGGDSPFPVTSDATNVISTPQTVTYQTKLSADEVIKFYQDEFGKKGYTEDTSLTTNFGGAIAMFFKDDNGKTIVLGGAPTGDGSMTVSLAYQQ